MEECGCLAVMDRAELSRCPELEQPVLYVGITGILKTQMSCAICLAFGRFIRRNYLFDNVFLASRDTLK